VKYRLLAKLRVITNVVLVVLALIPHIARSGSLYKWIDDNGIVHYSDSPPLKVPKSNIEVIKVSSSSRTSVIRVRDFSFTIQDIKMCWYLSVNSLQKEALFHPQISFTVKNESKKPLKDLRINALYIQENNKIFGKDVEYIDNIPPSYVSQTIFMHPSMGFVFNSFNKNTIMRNTFTIKLSVSLKGKEMNVGSLHFSSQETCY